MLKPAWVVGYKLEGKAVGGRGVMKLRKRGGD